MSAAWFNNPNAPRISHQIYSAEKSNFAGVLVGAILHGIVIALFFRCMIALLGPTNHTRKGSMWWLAAHTVALFSVATMALATGFFLLLVAYINGREFPGVSSGPFSYLELRKFDVVESISGSVIQVNQWLVDGLLLHRCYVIYGMNYWAVAIPFVIYLASWATGIISIYVGALPVSPRAIPYLRWGDAYYSIAVSLNVLLTLMLITRLVLHGKNIRRAVGYQDGASGLYKQIITMLVESGALYATSLVLLVGSLAAPNGSSVAELVTFQIFPEVQCIAPFLIILRVANRTALTSEAVASGTIGSIHFRSHGQSTGGDRILSNGNTIRWASDAHGGALEEFNAGAEDAIEKVPL